MNDAINSSNIEGVFDPSCWKEIRLENSDDGLFGHSSVCQAWIRQLASFVVNRLGVSPRIRVLPYSSGKTTLLAVDVYNSQTDMECVNITILLSDHTCLSTPADNQFDIALPGIIDAFSLTESLLFLTRVMPEYPRGLWL